MPAVGVPRAVCVGEGFSFPAADHRLPGGAPNHVLILYGLTLCLQMESLSASSPVSDFYRGRSVLITGSTGFMGKVLVEKLLRCCPDVSTLYLLMRPRRGVDARHRLDDLLNTTVRATARSEGVGRQGV